MKIALCIDYGSHDFPNELKEKLRKSSFPQGRVNIVDYIEKNGKFMSKYRNVYKLSSVYFSIEDVDTTRPWRITDYDGSEYIQYLDYDIVNKELNYCKLKDK